MDPIQEFVCRAVNHVVPLFLGSIFHLIYTAHVTTQIIAKGLIAIIASTLCRERDELI